MVTVDIEIDRPKSSVWKAITDIENCERMISSIFRIRVLNRPANDLVGLKWEETRKMFGKEATEILWITESEENEYYSTRAESHGSIYITKLSLSASASGSVLTMSFKGIPQTFTAKMLSFILSPTIKSSIKKALTKDLQDIKAYVEKS